MEAKLNNPVFHSWMVGNQKIIFIEFCLFVTEEILVTVSRRAPAFKEAWPSSGYLKKAHHFIGLDQFLDVL